MGYHRPTDLNEALTLLAEREMTILAGGTDIYPATDRSELSGDILDVTGLPSLSGLGVDNDFIRIGAAAKWVDIISAELPPALDALKLSAREVGSLQIQNSGTLGGNLCNASPAADGVPPLLVLDAEVELASLAGKRTMPLGEFIVGNRRTHLRDGEVMSAILIPKSSTAGISHFTKLGARKYLVISIAMVAVRLCIVDKTIESISIAVGSCSEVAKRLPEVETVLTGQFCDKMEIPEGLIVNALAPITDIRADAEYRLRAAAELVGRTLTEMVNEPR